MNCRSLIIWVLFLLFAYSLKAQNGGMQIRSGSSVLPQEYIYLVGNLDVQSHGETTRFVLADSSYIDLFYYPEGDSVLLIRSQCAPLCSSFARVYDSEWNILRPIPTPNNLVLPEAYVQNGELLWRENYHEEILPAK